MKKHLFRVLALVLLVLFPMQNALAEYCTMSGNMTNGGRKLNSFTLTDGVNSVSLSDIQSTTSSAIYYDGTSSVLTTSPGATLSFSALSWSGDWMHGYVFIDYNQDETFNNTLNVNGDNGGELVSYSFYSADGTTGSNSEGETYSSSTTNWELHDPTIDNMPAWILPSDLASGDYRLRFNIAWNSIDPCGYSDMATNGGAMVDVILRVEAAIAARTITVAKNPAEGGIVTINGSDVESLNAEGNITLVATANRGYDFAGWALEGETVSTDVTYIDATAGDKTYTANFAAKTAYPTMTNVYTNNLQQANRYLKEVIATQGENVTTVFSATTEDELPRIDPTATNTAMTEAQGALIDKTATPIIIEQGATEFTVNFKGWTESMTIGGTASSTQLQWTQQALFIDWNNNYDFYDEGENYGKSSNTMGNDEGVCASFISTDGYTRTISIPADVEPGTYRMRVCYNEPTDNSAAWDQTLFTTLNSQTRNGKSYDFAIQVVAGATPRTITVEASPAEGGVVKANDTVGGVTDAEGVVTITAEANEGYRFVNWTNKETSAVISTEATFTNNEDGDVTYVANFEEIPTYIVSVSVNDATMGEASASVAEVLEGSTVTLTATPNVGYLFVNWTVEGTEVSTEATYEATITEETTFVANFVEKQYCTLEGTIAEDQRGVATFTLSDGANSVTIEDVQTTDKSVYQDRTSVVLTTTAGATITPSVTFCNGWNGGWMYHYMYVDYNKDKEFDLDDEFVNNPSAYWITNLGSFTLPADIALGDYRLRYKIDWENTDPCGNAATATQNGGIIDVTIRVVPATVSRTITVEASPAEAGVVKANGTEGGVTAEGIITITAEANEGYRFVNWTNKATSAVVSEDATFGNNEAEDVTYVANFEKIPTYTVTVTLPDAEQGSIEINGEAAQSSYTVLEGTAVEMTATPAFGYVFSKWIINGNEVGENPFSVSSLTVDATVEAVFTKLTDEEVYASICKPSYSGAGNTTFVSSATMNVLTDTTTFDMGALAVVGQAGYIEAAEVYAGEEFNLNLTYTLNWGDLTLYQIVDGEATAIYGPFEGSWVSGGSTSTVLTNIVNAGLSVEGTTVAYPITIANDAKVGDLIIVRAMTGGSSACETGINEGGYLDFIFKVAEAPIPTYAVVAEASPAEGGEVTISAAEVEEGETVNLSALAKEGYNFVNWTVNGVEVSTSESFTSEAIYETTTFVANFVKKTFTVTVTSTAGGTATTDAVNPVEYGTNITLTATPDAGYEFVVWMVDGSEGATLNTWTIPVTENLDFEAVFALIQQGDKDVTVYDATEVNDAAYATVRVANEKVWDVQENAIAADKVSVKVEADGVAPEVKIADGGEVTTILEVSRIVEKGRWALMSLPFAVDLANVTVDGAAATINNNIKVMVYDAAYRAANSIELFTKSGWKDLEGTTIAANQGFAVAINSNNGDEQTVTFTAATQTYDGTDKQITLSRYASTVNEGADADWNFYGNPTLAKAQKGTGYALYVYNAEDDSYDEYASSDVATYQPYAAWFVQSADDFNAMNFSSGVAGALAEADGVYGELQFSLNGEDEARVVLVDESSEEYVRNEDALYFPAMNATLSQLYLVKGNIKMAVSEQPTLTSMALGYKAVTSGEQTLTLTTMPENTSVVLVDNVTGEETAMTLGDTYTFQSEAGTFNNRFVIETTDLTGISQVETDGDIKVVVNGNDINVYGAEAGTEVVAYATNGTVVASAVATDGVTTLSTTATGVIVVKVANTAVKVIK